MGREPRPRRRGPRRLACLRAFHALIPLSDPAPHYWPTSAISNRGPDKTFGSPQRTLSKDRWRYSILLWTQRRHLTFCEPLRVQKKVLSCPLADIAAKLRRECGPRCLCRNSDLGLRSNAMLMHRGRSVSARKVPCTFNLGCVIPCCNLQSGITQPILQLF